MAVCKAQDAEDVWFIANNLSEPYAIREYKKRFDIEEMFKDKEEIILEDSKIILLLNGVKMNMEKPNGIYRIYNKQNKFIGLGIVQNKILKIDIRS